MLHLSSDAPATSLLPLPPGMRLRCSYGGPLLRSALPFWPVPRVDPRSVELWVRGGLEQDPPPKRVRTEPPPEAAASSSARVLTDAVVLSRRKALDEERGVYLDGFAELVRDFGSMSGLLRRMQDSGEEVSGRAPSLIAALSGKSTATLAKRLCSLRLLRRWFRDVGKESFALTEATLFEYFEAVERDKGPPGRPQALREALAFASGALELQTKGLDSSRVRGSALKSLERRPEIQQRAPLTVEMVAHLERIAANPLDSDSLMAGALCFTLFGRARVGDIRRGIREPTLDERSGNQGGFVQTELLAYKTARPGTKRAMPIVAPLCGVTAAPWAQTWLRSRAAEGLVARDGFGLFAARLASGGWSTLSLSTTEVGAELRRILLAGGFVGDALRNVGAHSLKATCLSWAAKRGVAPEARRLLGYHRTPGERSTASYSRDELAGPLRELDSLLAEVRAKTFCPDSTRSGYLRATPAPSIARSPSPSRSSSSSSSSASSDEKGAAVETTTKDANEDVTLAVGDAVLNRDSGVLHRFAEGGRLECGRRLPKNGGKVADWPADQRLCQICW